MFYLLEKEVGTVHTGNCGALPEELVDYFLHCLFLALMCGSLCQRGQAPYCHDGRCVDLPDITVGASLHHRDVDNSFDGILQLLRAEPSKLW